MSSQDDTGNRPWKFLTNHARVLICIASDPGIRVREIAHCADITERAATSIVGDLEKGGYITRHRTGRRNTYTLNPKLPLPDHAGPTTSDLIALFSPHQHRRRETRTPPPPQ